MGLLVLTACGSGTVEIERHDPSDADAKACRALVADLPETLAGRSRIEVTPADALGAAWGDPAYVLTCGVPEPQGYEATAECSEMSGVGWFVPSEQLSSPGEDTVATALSRTPYVELLIPAQYRTDGLDAALAELAPAIEVNLAAAQACL